MSQGQFEAQFEAQSNAYIIEIHDRAAGIITGAAARICNSSPTDPTERTAI